MIARVNLQIQATEDIDILSIIPTNVLQEIKLIDPHPLFKAYSICHEGISTPKFLGDTSQKSIHWTRAAIQSLKNILIKGVKFFKGHNADNSIIGREVLGEIVADTQIDIGGKLNHVVVGYFPNKKKVSDLDICSQEAEWSLIEEAKNYIASKIEKLTGVALGNSKIDKPAFSDTKCLALVQAFDYNNNIIEEKGDNKIMDLSIVSFNDLKDELKKRNTFPGQLFSIDDLKKDNQFGPLIKELETKTTDLESKLNEKEKFLKIIEEEKKELSKKYSSATARERLDKSLSDLKVPFAETQKKYILYEFSKGIDDPSDDGIKKFIQSALDQYKEIAPVFDTEKQNIEVDNSDINSAQKVDKNDFTKAANNPFLTEDFSGEVLE